jgi:hypothetical protein
VLSGPLVRPARSPILSIAFRQPASASLHYYKRRLFDRMGNDCIR